MLVNEQSSFRRGGKIIRALKYYCGFLGMGLFLEHNQCVLGPIQGSILAI